MNTKGSAGALVGQTILVIGGSSGIGFETAKLGRSEGAEVIITGRDPVRLEQAARELAAKRSAAFDATSSPRLARFFEELSSPVDHVMLTAGRPHYGRILDVDRAAVLAAIENRLSLIIEVARHAAAKVRAGGALVFMSGTDARRPQIGSGMAGAIAAAVEALTRNLALELAPIRVNLIAAGFVDTRLSASILGEKLDARREELRASLPIRRVVGPADVAALAVHVMTNTALAGATLDVDGGQQLLAH